jgi:hypothetical protein
MRDWRLANNLGIPASAPLRCIFKQQNHVVHAACKAHTRLPIYA